MLTIETSGIAIGYAVAQQLGVPMVFAKKSKSINLSGDIYVAVLLIGAITFALSALGVKIGNVFGSRFEKKAQFAGGAILILLGLKILLEGLGVI